MSSYDVIVIGLGGMGAATLYELARRGLKVLGLEQFTIAHDRGSSHGETRIIRRAYFEHPAYVPLVDRAYELWARLESETSRKLFYRTGLFLSGPSDGEIIRGTRFAARQHRLDIDELSQAHSATRFPQFTPSMDSDILFEPDAGFLLVEDCVRAHLDAARQAGAGLLENTPVLRWDADDCGVTVETAAGKFHAASLAICGGPWSAQLLRTAGVPLEVLRKAVLWVEVDNEELALDRGCPIYGFEIQGRFFYGFPSLDHKTVKVAEHTGRQLVAEPTLLDRGLHPEDATPLIEFARSCLRGVSDRIARHSVCMYTMTPDQHFIVDRHAHYPNVAFAAGFSGHGFKFAPVIAEMLADILTQTQYTGLELFNAKRFAK